MSKFQDRFRIESARLPGWDYATNGWYFVTICTHGRQHFFGEVRSRRMHLSDIGMIAHQYWADIPQHTVGVRIDEFVVMPNHVHGIVVIDRWNEFANGAPPCRDVPWNVSTGVGRNNQNSNRNFDGNPDRLSAAMSALSPKSGSLSVIIRSYKSSVTRWCKQNNHPEFQWQPRFHDHLIRTPDARDRIRHYIRNNPYQWKGKS